MHLLAADKVPNASPTAASASSDMYGSAAVDACRQLKERLAPYFERLLGKSFQVGGCGCAELLPPKRLRAELRQWAARFWTCGSHAASAA